MRVVAACLVLVGCSGAAVSPLDVGAADASGEEAGRDAGRVGVRRHVDAGTSRTESTSTSAATTTATDAGFGSFTVASLMSTRETRTTGPSGQTTRDTAPPTTSSSSSEAASSTSARVPDAGRDSGREGQDAGVDAPVDAGHDAHPPLVECIGGSYYPGPIPQKPWLGCNGADQDDPTIGPYTVSFQPVGGPEVTCSPDASGQAAWCPGGTMCVITDLRLAVSVVGICASGSDF